MAGLDYGYYKYTTDRGDEYNVRLSTQFGGLARLGFGAYDDALPIIPKGWKMRYALFVNAASGRRRKIPVGAIAADIWSGAETDVSLAVIGSATPVVFTITALRGEQWDIAHAVVVE